jgi:hypothetical protein
MFSSQLNFKKKSRLPFPKTPLQFFVWILCTVGLILSVVGFSSLFWKPFDDRPIPTLSPIHEPIRIRPIKQKKTAASYEIYKKLARTPLKSKQEKMFLMPSAPVPIERPSEEGTKATSQSQGPVKPSITPGTLNASVKKASSKLAPQKLVKATKAPFEKRSPSPAQAKKRQNTDPIESLLKRIEQLQEGQTKRASAAH